MPIGKNMDCIYRKMSSGPQIKVQKGAARQQLFIRGHAYGPSLPKRLYYLYACLLVMSVGHSMIFLSVFD